jgi:hypothetical protein
VVKINQFTFSTGPRPVPLSIQTERKFPGGVDKVGSLASGDIVVGRLGDDDFDGHVDGVFFAMGQLPLSSPFLPGSPFVQRMEFTSTIPIVPLQAVQLTVATARNCLRRLLAKSPRPRSQRNAATLRDCVEDRIAMAAKQFARIGADPGTCGPKCPQVEALAAAFRKLEPELRKHPLAAGDLTLLETTSSELVVLRPRCTHCGETGPPHSAALD